MNPNCGFCESQAKVVCKHPDCNYSPLICNELCNNKAGSIVHTHNGKKDLIPYEQFLRKVD